MRYLINVILRYRSQFSFFITLLFSIILYSNNSSPQVLFLRTQFSDAARWVLQPLSQMQYLVTVEEENALLRESNMQLRLQLESMLYLQNENDRLRSLLNFKDKNPLNLIPASIVTKGMKASVQSAIIDVGTMDGVRENSGVLSTRGVVGKVISAGERSAIVELLNDVNFRLAVRVLPEGATGIMRYIDDDQCEIREIPKNAVISVGDRVVTSGFSDIYPAGLPVGIVSGIFEERGSFQKVVTVDIYDKLNAIMHVFVIGKNEQ